MRDPSSGGSIASQSSIVFWPIGARALRSPESLLGSTHDHPPTDPANSPTCIFIQWCRQVDSIVTQRPFDGGRGGRGGTITVWAVWGRTSDDRERHQIRVDAGRLWRVAATALVAGLIAVVGILIARGIVQVEVLAPKAEGAWGNANTVTYALVWRRWRWRHGLLHLLLLTPRGRRRSSPGSWSC